MDDLPRRVGVLESHMLVAESTIITIQASIENLSGTKLEKIDQRLRTIERLVWVATGGVIIIGAGGIFFMNALINAISK